MKAILSIDGGGIRGLIPGLWLVELAKLLAEAIGLPLHKVFDLLAGTSTGGIISLGLAKGMAPEELAALYSEFGDDIFNRGFFRRVRSAGALVDEKYSHEALERLLAEYFGDTPMSEALTRVMVTAYGIQSMSTRFIKSWKDEHYLMRDAARDTSAAPTFFEPTLRSMDGRVDSYIDGGVFINNPVMSAYVEAKKLWPEEDLLIVSLGTGSQTKALNYQDAKGWGLLGWAPHILTVMMDGQSDCAHYQASQLLAEDRYFRFDVPLEHASAAMDDATPRNIEALKLEANRLLRTHRGQMERVAEMLVS